MRALMLAITLALHAISMNNRENFWGGPLDNLFIFESNLHCSFRYCLQVNQFNLLNSRFQSDGVRSLYSDLCI
jgi:hypothetical protein